MALPVSSGLLETLKRGTGCKISDVIICFCRSLEETQVTSEVLGSDDVLMKAPSFIWQQQTSPALLLRALKAYTALCHSRTSFTPNWK